MTPPDADAVLFEAIAFAAYAHRHQLRKDDKTPYVSHVFRVAMVVRHVFGIDDPNILAAAVLHDTIEDTTTDYDDLSEKFGPTIATWVAALTKNTMLPDQEREADYSRRLAAGGWPVCICKLADMYDNLADSKNLTPEQQKKSVKRVKFYLDALLPAVTAESRHAYDIVLNRHAEVGKLLAMS